MDRTDFEATDYHQGRDVMAKRKQRRPRKGTRKPAGVGRATSGRGGRRNRAPAKKASARGARKGTKKAAKGRKKTASRGPARASAAKKARPARKAAGKRSGTTRSAAARKTGGKVLSKRPGGAHRLQISRPRRVLEEPAAGPPSSLDFDRHASAARTGREELREARREHTESSPRLTGGDVDANWASAFSTGDEAPGGDMPTPDQDVVEEIGSSLGVQYADDEELKAVDKIEQRDRHRWELDPASAEDYRDRGKKE